MKHKLLIVFLLSSMAVAGQKGLSVTAAYGASVPQGAFKSRFNTAVGSSYGLHVDYTFGLVGIGLYAGAASNSSGAIENPFIPVSMHTSDLKYDTQVQSMSKKWRTNQVGIGPVFKTKITGKLSASAFLKGGIAKLDYPAYTYFLRVEQPYVDEIKFDNIVLFENYTSPALRTKTAPLILAGLNLNYNITKRLDLQIGGHFSKIAKVYNEISGFALSGLEESSPSYLASQLESYSDVSSKGDSNFNSLHFSLGLRYNFSK